MPKTALGDTASDSGTVVITLTETGTNQATQDVDFCLPPTAAQRPANTSTFAGTPTVVDHGYYDNGAQSVTMASTTESYCAGESITPPAASCTLPSATATNNPDTASSAQWTLTTPSDAGTNTNPSGKDYVDDVKYNHDHNQGPIRDYIEFGIAGLTPGSATIDACIDRNPSGTCNTAGTPPDRTSSRTRSRSPSPPAAGGLVAHRKPSPGRRTARPALRLGVRSPRNRRACRDPGRNRVWLHGDRRVSQHQRGWDDCLRNRYPRRAGPAGRRVCGDPG